MEGGEGGGMADNGSVALYFSAACACYVFSCVE